MATGRTGENLRDDCGTGLGLWDETLPIGLRGYQPVLVRSVDAAIDELSAIRPQAVYVGLRFQAPVERR